MSDWLDLSGLRILVTGSSVGIGAAAAEAYAQAGASVAIHANTSVEAARALADRLDGAVVVTGDVGTRAEAERIVREAAEALGGLDVLVNNAGSLVERRPIAEVDDALYDQVFDLNLRAVLAASQAALPWLKQSPSASIINLGSIAGADGGGLNSGHYAAAKAAVHAMTKHLARDWARFGIRVNAIAPGVIATAFHAATPPERMEAMRNAVPLGRVGDADDIAGTFLYLAAPKLSGYVTGQTIHVNGGQYMA
jgi:3-oxoacyl-[acyl-carrier protein] reductase